jgi:hypothetical protein
MGETIARRVQLACDMIRFARENQQDTYKAWRFVSVLGTQLAVGSMLNPFLCVIPQSVCCTLLYFCVRRPFMLDQRIQNAKCGLCLSARVRLASEHFQAKLY